MKNIKKIVLFVIAMCLFIGSLFAVGALASEPIDAMADIEKNLAEQYRVLEPTVISNDGYIGIPVEYSVYFDKGADGNKKAVPGFTVNGGTPLALYIVNTATERVGKDSDTEIITSLLERGFIVAVIDYMNSPRTVSPYIDWSTQELRRYFGIGNYISAADCIPKGSYKDNYVIPAGCNVSHNNVFWEADKHAADGTLEKIVEIWNNDFRGTTGDIIIKWVDENGVRKATQNAPSKADGARDTDDPRHDGSSPVWYMDAKGTPETAPGEGQYIQVKHTKAESIYDCVDPDGKPIDLNLYMHIVYPTSTDKAVPVTALASSSTYCTTAKTGADMRPHSNGFLFRGYANVVFDYLWVPMARMASYDYFDGKASAGAVTNDQLTYSLQVYNDKRINTAAMRYLRYVNNERDEFNFDTESIGVYGNSKGGWFTFIGSAELHNPTEIIAGKTLAESIDARINSYTSKRVFPNHADETRYQIGKTESVTRNGFTVDGGELQPWLTYKTGALAGQEIPSWATVLYPCCAPAYEDIEEGHAPMFLSSNIDDEYRSAYYSSNIRTNIARIKDVPSLTLESTVAHMLTYGEDLNFGVDTYDAFFDFFGYYLKGESVKVVYISPKSGAVDRSAFESIAIRTIGSVAKSEIERVTVKDSRGNAVVGEWESQYGNTEWIFTPSAPLLGGESYTVTVPAGIKGDNGSSLLKSVSSTFTVRYGEVTAATVSGSYITASVPTVLSGNGFKVRFKVANDAANIAKLYAVSSLSATDGEYIGSVNLIGKGYYEIDATDYVMQKSAGEVVYFLVKAEKAAGSVSFKDDFVDTNSSGYTTGSDYRSRFAAYVRDVDTKYPNKGDKHDGVVFDGVSAVKFVMGTSGKVYKNLATQSTDIPYNEFYARLMSAVFNDTLINGGREFTEADYGRKFEIKLRIYDTTSRDLLFYVESMSGYYNDYTYKTMDYNQSINNFNTKANEWVELTLEYTVRDTDFGKASEYEAKRIMLEVSPEGYLDASGNRVDYPMYIDYLSVTETVTDIEIEEAYLVETLDGSGEYKAPTAEKPITVLNGNVAVGSYTTFGEALSAASNGYTLRLNSNVTVADGASVSFSRLSSLTLDLNGYKLMADTKKTAVFNFAPTEITSGSAAITVKNGSVYFGDMPLVGYADSASGGGAKSITVTFDSVHVSLYSRTAYATELISESAANTDVKAKIIFNACSFRIEDSVLSKMPITMFPEGSDKLDVSYVVRGGEIKLDSERWISITSGIKSLTFAPDSRGEYTALLLPESEKDNSASYMTEKGIASFAPDAAVGGYTSYSLEAGPLSTKYGIIPDAYASIDSYPFVIFDESGNFVAAKDLFQNVLEAFKGKANADWYVVMRRDVTYSKKYDNLGQGKGKLHVDLGGHTMTLSGSNVMMYNLDAKKDGDISLTTVNGTVVVGSTGAVRFLGWDTDTYNVNTVKNIDVTFEGITFKLGGSTTDLVTYYHERKSTENPGPMNSKVSFVDCVFDVTGAASVTTLFNVGAQNNGAPLTGIYEVIGGKIIADSGSMLTVYKIGEESSSIIFKRGDDGEFIKTYVKTGGAAPVADLETPEGLMTFEQRETDGAYTVYECAERTVYESVTTEYGVIPADKANPYIYPIVVFDKNKNFVGTASNFTVEAASMASSQGDGAVILIRRDFNLSNDKHGKNSLSNVNGTITVDLGGNTVEMGTKSANGRDAFIRLEACVAGYTTNVIVKNGTVLSGDNPIARFAAINGRVPTTYNENGAQKAFDYWNNENPDLIHNLTITLDGIRIGLGSVGGSYIGLYTGATSGYTVAPSAANNKLILKDCNLEFMNPTSSAVLFASNVSVPAHVELVGGTLNYNDNEKIKWEALNTASKSELTIAPNDSGEYFTVTVPSTISLSTERKVISGENTFVYTLYKKSEAVGKRVYTFRPKDLKAVNVKESYTLDKDFVLRLYVDKLDFISSVTIGSATYTGDDLLAMAEGEYFVIPYAVKLTDAEENITVEVIASFREDYKSEYSAGIVDYAKAGILGSEWDDSEKTLVRSMLDFTRAAYAYFADVSEISSDKLSSLEAKTEGLIPDSDPAEISGGENVTVGLDFATVNIGSEIKLFFFASEGYSPEDFTFTVGEEELEAVAVGSRIELSVPLYILGDPITYSVEGREDSGVYYLTSYYAYMAAEGEGSDLLLDLVAKLLNYSEAAKNYQE